ncbi:MAG: hypothetical protein IT232_07365 [Flavobacteriales bacterium]|nr:hypothetical protein [Flavobacteriales bacterium]
MKYSVVLIVLALAIFSCKKEEEKILPPTISFLAGNEYTPNGAVVEVGRKLFFGIKAEGTDANLTNFTIKKKLTNGQVIPIMDTALYNQTINLSYLFYQNIEDTAVWIFSVMDRNRQSAFVSLTVYKDPNSQFGGIYYYPSIKLGYQSNTIYGHFLNAVSGTIHSNDSANTNPDLIDIFIYQYIDSDGVPTPAFSSPGEMDNFSTYPQTFYPDITSWSPRNYTKWDISIDNGNNAPITATDFYNAQNDSLLIVSYHDIWGKKKFKYVSAGKIIPFKTTAGKLGLIKVLHADNVDGTGMIEFEMKIQQ